MSMMKPETFQKPKMAPTKLQSIYKLTEKMLEYLGDFL